jgi:hypothetical protein
VKRIIDVIVLISVKYEINIVIGIRDKLITGIDSGRAGHGPLSLYICTILSMFGLLIYPKKALSKCWQ